MGLCLLLKIWAKTLAVNMIKYLLIMLKNPGEIAPKTFSKRVIQKTAEATGDFIGNNSFK